MSEQHDSDRPPMVPEQLRRAVVVPGSRWTQVQVVAETGSTNADLAALALTGAAEGLVLIAEHQRAGRGRLDRAWRAPAGAGLTFSVLLRPAVEPARLGWVPLLAGVALAQVCRGAGVPTALKWPNDLLVRPAGTGAWGKCGGILAELIAPDAVVLGIGINVCQRADELPPPSDPRAHRPTSLAMAGSSVRREQVAIEVLRELDRWYGHWLAAGGDPVQSGVWGAYRDNCRTLGRSVTAVLPGGATLTGMAADIDIDGRLLLETKDGARRVGAGDVYHVR